MMEGLIGYNTNPTAKVTSGVTGLVILFLIYQNVFPEYNTFLFIFLGLHLISQISASLIEHVEKKKK